MARIMLVYDTLTLKHGVFAVCQRGQLEFGDVQVAPHLAHFIFITRFNAKLTRRVCGRREASC